MSPSAPPVPTPSIVGPTEVSNTEPAIRFSSGTTSRSALVLPIACAVCAVLAAAYVIADDPADGDGGLTPCPVRALTGRWCPGCGLTRATHHLFRGNVAQALSFNALVAPILLGLIGLWWLWLRVATGRSVPAGIRHISTDTYLLASVIVVAFTVLRNVPAWPVLRGG